MAAQGHSTSFVFEKDELHLSGREGKIRIRGWPQPESVERGDGHGERPCRPAFRLVARDGENRPFTPVDKFISPLACDFKESNPLLQKQKADAYAVFRASLPPELVTAIERFQSHQWNLIDLAWERKEFIDLLQGNPVLAYFFANNDEFRKLSAKSPAFQARWHVHKKQREVAVWLGFSRSESIVKLIRKIVPESVSPSAGRLLREALHAASGEVAKAIAHLERINAGVLRLVGAQALLSLTTPGLLVEVAANESEVYYPETADLLADLACLFERIHPRSHLQPFHSIRRIREMHEELAVALRARQGEELQQQLQRAFQRQQRKLRLAAARTRRLAAARTRRLAAARTRRKEKEKRLEAAPPPVPGTEDIILLTKEYELRAEGHEQCHCVGDYFFRIKKGWMRVYKVLKPERATLALVCDRHGKWRVYQLRLARNRPPSPETIKAVHEWLTTSQLRQSRADPRQSLFGS